MKQFFSIERMTGLARQAAADGCVLLENENATLPLRDGDRVAVFGRIAFDYYKSGLGSGGLVNTRYVVGILDALKAEKSIVLDPDLLRDYEEWMRENPYDHGQGWGQVPWSQKEMPVDAKRIAEAAKKNDIAIVVIGRTAGEDQDIRNDAGSYLLTDVEKDLIRDVCAGFKRAAVLLNVGSIIDMNWVKEYRVPAVLYVWQGGQEGGNGVCDILTGRVSPSGRLSDTIAKSIESYPSTKNFGDPIRNIYAEDIYVGYRYFETFAKEEVLYPFGYGLSYTDFQTEAEVEAGDEIVRVKVKASNTGKASAREAVTVFVEAPQGKLGKASRVLVDFDKTGLLAPGESQELVMDIPKYRFASYDDSGKSGQKNGYVLEGGRYRIYVGGDVRNAKFAGEFQQEFCVLSELEEAYAPVTKFQRMVPVQKDGMLTPGYEDTPLRSVDVHRRRKERLPQEILYTGNKGYRLRDVYEKKVEMDAFVAQLSDANLIHIFRGEGMCSPKVTPGTASAFGGVTDELRNFGIPLGCCADGPSGIRMDCGTRAFSLPNGTLLGCTFDIRLQEELFTQTGLELRKNRIDTLLGPGMNIHRNPLNGRNFEYISEDPLLTGLIAAAQLRGLNKSGTTGTVKHFCGNNQEFKRREADGVVSERALREIYLKGFEYAVKLGDCRSVMTTYGPINGIWTAGSYDLNTVILRREWGFDGIVMTDWWAAANREGEEGKVSTRAPMVAAQNDLFMVTADATEEGQDDLFEALESGELTRGELQRCAKNVLAFLLKSVAMEYEMDRISEEEREANKPEEDDVDIREIQYCRFDPESGEVVIDTGNWEIRRGHHVVCAISNREWGSYEMDLSMRANANPVAQLSFSIYFDNVLKTTVSIQGTEGRTVKRTLDFGMIFGNNHYIKFYFSSDGLEMDEIVLRCVKPVDPASPM